MKKKIYKCIAEVVVCEDYSTVLMENIKEVNVTNLVFTIISSMIAAFRTWIQHTLCLCKEKKTTAVDKRILGF